MRTLALAALATLAACGGGSEDAEETSRPAAPVREDLAQGEVRRDARTVILVVVDGLRRDHLKLYGAERETAPTLTYLASEGVVYEDAIAVTTGANGGLASLWTGATPFEHGVGSLRHRGQHRLGESQVTLAERLREEGWRTLGAVSLSQFDAALSGLDQGFERWYAPYLSERNLRDATATWFNAKPDLARLLKGDEPVFCALHFADPGAGGAASGADGAEFLESYLAPFRAENELLSNALDRLAEDPIVGQEELKKLLGRGRSSESHLAWKRAGYDSHVKTVDAAVDDLWQLLEENGRAQDTFLAITSTRGALLAPPQSSGGPAFPPALIDVPLIVRYPGGAPAGRIPGTHSVRELHDAVLAVTGLERSAPLIGWVDGSATPPERARVFAPGFELVGEVNPSFVVEENRITGTVLWDRAGQRLEGKKLEGAQLDGYEAMRARLGEEGRGDEMSWLIVEGNGATARVSWQLFSGFLGATDLDGKALRPSGVRGSARLEATSERLRCRLGEREPAIRFDIAWSGDPGDLYLGNLPLEQSLVPRLRDKGGAPWPEEATASASLTDRGSGWWRLRVGDDVPPGTPVEVVLVAYPPAPMRDALEWNPGSTFDTIAITGRDDGLQARGAAPLELSLHKVSGISEFAVAVHVDGVAVDPARMRYGDRVFAEPGEVSFYLPDWWPNVTESLHRAGGELDPGSLRVTRTGPVLELEERRGATVEERLFATRLGGRE